MKTFFVIMLLTSISVAVYSFFAGINVMAHNHFESRYDLLDTSKRQPDHVSRILGLTPKELESCDDYVAGAYKESVNDGYRLGTGYRRLGTQMFFLSAILFLTSWVGLQTVKRKPVVEAS
jgi:hypothetical protein